MPSNAEPHAARRSQQPGELTADEVIDGRYRIIDRIASGGMGSVYRVEHLELGRVMALKVMLPGLSGHAELLARFKNEAIAVSRIGHQNIAAVTDFGQVRGRFYFVMEFVDGRTLRHALRTDGPFSPERTRRIGLQLARALASAHEAGIVHRDLKPDNVMLTLSESQPDFVKVLDFGVAKMITLPAGGALTVPGALIGTPEYMAPEQVLGREIDGRADVYVLGLLLHELLTGKRTFSAPAPQIFLLQVEGVPAPLPGVGIPPALDALVMQMLQKGPEARPASMAEVVARLEAIGTRAAGSMRPEASAPTVLMMGLEAVTSKVPAVRAERLELVAEDEEAEDPPDLDVLPPARRWPWIGAALVAALAIGGGVWFSLGPPVIKAPSPAPASVASSPVREGAAASGSVSDPVEPPPAPGPEQVAAPPDQPATAEPSGGVASARTVKISLQTSPPGAEVYEHDVLLGVTPVELRREADVVTQLTFRLKNFEPLERKMVLQADTALVLELAKKGKPAAAPARPSEARSHSVSELKEDPW